MSKILFVVGHTDISNDSVVTKEVVKILQSEFPQSTFSILSELYKDFQIDSGGLQFHEAVCLSNLLVWFSFFIR